MNKTERKTLLWIGRYAQKQLLFTLILSVLSAAISGSYIWIAWISKKILDAAGAGENDLIRFGGLLGAVILLQVVANLLMSYLRVSGQMKMENRIRCSLLQHLMKTDYQEFIKMHTGEYMNRLTSDVEIVAGGTIQFLPQVFSMVTRIGAGLAVLFVLDRTITILVLFGGLVVALGAKAAGKHFRYLYLEVQKKQGKMWGFLQECLENVIVIKAFRKEELTDLQVLEKQEALYRAKIRQSMVGSMSGTGFYLLTAIGYYSALVWGASKIAGGTLTFGTLTAFLQILEQLRAPFRNLSGAAARYDKVIASAERLIEIEETQSEEQHCGQTKEQDITCYKDMSGITVESCSFSYGKKLVIKDFSVFIPKGEVIAVTGSSGCGKSTFFHLLMGILKPQSGSIYIETEGKRIPIDETTRGMFAYVPQGNLILSGTIRENLLFGNPDATEEELHQAIYIACLDEVIKELPDGIYSVLRERGIGLSEGQRQRIAIARAVVSKASILLLDECTSALDHKTEKELLCRLASLKEKTILCISHRTAATKWCSRNMELENNRS